MTWMDFHHLVVFTPSICVAYYVMYQPTFYQEPGKQH